MRHAKRRGMSHRYVESLLGRLATDPALRRRFSRNRAALLRELQSGGFELTGIELDALASTEPGAIDRFAESLDERLHKAELTNPSQEASMSPMSQAETTVVPVHGTCPDRFEKVREAFIANFVERGDVGASAAVYIDGEPVVDLWGGYFDESRSKPWERDTIVNNF